MSRKLPLVGGNGMGSNAGARLAVPNPDATTTVTTLWVDQAPAIAVVGAHVSAGAEAFVNHVIAALDRRGRVHVVQRTSEPAVDTRLLVIVGSHVPRALRDPGVHELWERADVLLSDPSAIVAHALATAL